MKDFQRPFRWFGTFALLGLGALGMAPGISQAQAGKTLRLLGEPGNLMAAAGGGSTQGYLGVDLADVDVDKIQALKLKDRQGAVITLIDHDAPAGQAGLRVNDVVLEMNGESVKDAEQLRRMLKDVPPGRKITLAISRDGAEQTLTVELADREAMEQSIWNRIIGRKTGSSGSAPALGFLGGGGSTVSGGGFHLPFFGSNLNVGVLVEPLTAQMAAVLGVPSGLMVKQVTSKSQAEAAGLQAFDVILKVGTENMGTLASWDRALRANEGKPVRVIILRNRQQQTLTMQVDTKHKESELRRWPLGSARTVPAAS